MAVPAVLAFSVMPPGRAAEENSKVIAAKDSRINGSMNNLVFQ
jgi:hypothetical protein